MLEVTNAGGLGNEELRYPAGSEEKLREFVPAGLIVIKVWHLTVRWSSP